MPVSHNINRYSDVKLVLDAAVQAKGARYTLPSAKAAIAWRFRAHTFINMASREANARALPGETRVTPYDNFQLRVSGCIVEIKERMPAGKLTDLTGRPLEEAKLDALAPLDEDDPLLEVARGLVDNLDLDDL